MTAAHLSGIDHTVQLTREWIRELDRDLAWDNEPRSYRLLRATLHALRDCLDVNEAAQLGAQLPQLVRGIYYEGWHPAGMPVSKRGKQDFIDRIQAAFKTDPLADPEQAISRVFALLNRHVSKGEIKDVRLRLKKHLQELWPEDAEGSS
jgi:uncharacterized protein (DUF2267 family)